MIWSKMTNSSRREMGAEAEVLANTESAVLGGIFAKNIKIVRLLKQCFVAIYE